MLYCSINKNKNILIFCVQQPLTVIWSAPRRGRHNKIKTFRQNCSFLKTEIVARRSPSVRNSMADVTPGTETPKHLRMSSDPPPGGPATPNKLPSITPGGPASGQGFIPSFADACKLVSAPYSCLVLDTHRRHIGLPPVYLQRKRTGIQEELDTELLKYSEK